MKPNTRFLDHMYNIDNAVAAPKSNAPIPAGITENVQLKSVYFEALKQDGTGGNVLKFNFEDAAGRNFRHTEWEVDVERQRQMAKQWGKDPDKQVANALMGLSGRIKHILSCFMPKDKVVISGNTWDEFGGNVVALLGDAYKGVDLRVKLILNGKDYTSFPKQAFRPFVQRMDVPNTLVIDAKYERTTPKSSTPNELEAMLDSQPGPNAVITPVSGPAPWDDDQFSSQEPTGGAISEADDDLVF